MSYWFMKYERPKPEMICDFCSSPEKPQHTFECQSFPIKASGELFGIPVSASDGHWCACPACAQLVQDERWDELAQRSAERFCQLHPGARDRYDVIYEHMRQVHQEFRMAYRSTQ
jgi:hypothetical protein